MLKPVVSSDESHLFVTEFESKGQVTVDFKTQKQLLVQVRNQLYEFNKKKYAQKK